MSLTLTFHPPDRRGRDDDNLIASCKAYRDGLAQALGIDDKALALQAPQWGAVVKGGQVVITVEEITP